MNIETGRGEELKYRGSVVANPRVFYERGPCGAEASEDDWYPRWRERMPLGDVPEEPAVG